MAAADRPVPAAALLRLGATTWRAALRETGGRPRAQLQPQPKVQLAANSKLERETGPSAPSTKHRVEFLYRVWSEFRSS